jgi:lipocalin
MLRFTALATLLLASTSTHAQDNGECATVTTVENFDIDTYAAAPWYVHQQAETSYSPIDQNFCVKAEYTVKDTNRLFGYSVDVFNQAETEDGSKKKGNLCAYQTDEALSKLAVAPCWLPKFFAGPYWVVAYNETEGYALISGGQPTEPVDGGLCRSGTGTNNSGLWIFSRSQNRDEELVSKVRGIAEAAGFDLSVLNNVDQTSCIGCADVRGTFATYSGEQDCDWVGGRFSWFKCWFYSDECPVTCGAC